MGHKMQTLREMAYLYYSTTNMPVTLIEKETKQIVEQIGVKERNRLEVCGFPFQELEKSHYFNFSPESGVQYISAKFSQDKMEFILIAGPFVYTKHAEITAEGVMTVRPGKTNQFYKLLEHLFESRKLIFNDVTQDLSSLESLEKNIIEYREIDFYHHNYVLESNHFTEIFRSGDINKVFSERDRTFPETGYMSKNEEGNKKNWTIIGIGLFARKAIELGLDSHIAFTISDNYLRRIEQVKSIADMDMISQECFRVLFAALKTSTSSQYSRTINEAITFVDRNLTLKFSLVDVCEHIKVSQSHLSRLFKKEIGLSFTDYVLERRIEEAKRLLDHSNYSLADISGILNFSTKSYFISCFKKLVGKTPTEYRNKSVNYNA